MEHGEARKPAADQRYYTVEDIKKYFDKNPSRLVMYVETGMGIRRVAVLATHVAQLADKVGIPLKSGVHMYATLPETFVNLEHFDNIGDIINEGCARFPVIQ